MTPDLRALALETVREFGTASLGFVAWEIDVTEEQLAAVWTGAKSDGLIEPAGICPETGERLYRLTGLGRAEPR